MSDRAETLRQQARAEAADREQRLVEAMRLQDSHWVPAGRGRVAYGETTCPRCGVRSGVGCKHSPAGAASTGLSSHSHRSSLT